ncbi:class I glutamine amidotransferase-like protein [Lineolata rhizophorae]|uniref:Class I glutamine amidotransferase-like protein n=1 Tax=Lineolata rhizophorae TaxID=578093 RepID=A0A6A6NMR7_9PEZI|nr:class I glutamine amidotransferase-like protein [Lineolata rhizophorae]
MSAIQDDSKNEPIGVLFALHKGFDTLDFTGPYEVLASALHDSKNPDSKAFKISTAGDDSAVTSAQGLTVRADMDWEDALDRLDEFDVLVVPGGGSDAVLRANAQPQALVKAYAEMQQQDPSHERTLFSVCTGALFLAQAGVLQGLAATTHPDFYTKLEIVCAEAARGGRGERTDVMEERYVVNNARFELGENWDENPFIMDRKAKAGETARRKSAARKGSDAWRMSRRRESVVKRAALPLGGLRVLTSGGVTAGIDAALYLVAALVSFEAALERARVLQFSWSKGVTVEGIDV